MRKMEFENRALTRGVGCLKGRWYLKRAPQYLYLFPSSILITFIIVIVIIKIGSNLSSISIPLFLVSRKSIYLFFFNLLMFRLYTRFKHIFSARLLYNFFGITTTSLPLCPEESLKSLLPPYMALLNTYTKITP